MSQIVPDNYKLTMKVATFFNGLKWVIYPLAYMEHNPIIHTTIFSQDININDNISTTYDVSLCFCPVTHATVIFYGRAELATQYETCENKSDLTMCVKINGNIISLLGNHKGIKKVEVEIDTLKNAISDHPDCEYFNSNKMKCDIPLIIKKNTLFTTKTYHHNTLVMLIEYSSLRTTTTKKTIVIGHDADKHSESGYDSHKSLFHKWLDTMEYKIRDRFGFITRVKLGGIKIEKNMKIIKL